MNLNALIVHKLDKEVQGVTTVTLRKNLLAISEKEKKFITNVKQAYYKKSNPNYGIFDGNAVSFPYQTMLKSYVNKEQEFLQFSESAMKHLENVIKDVQQASGGFVVFAHYTFQNEEFVITVMLNSKEQFNINDSLGIDEIFSLDIDKLDVANSVNITRWNNSEDTYLSFARGRKDVSNYFKRFIGCTDQTSAKQSSESLKRAFLDYLPKLGLDTPQEEDLRNSILNYCYSQTKKKEDISLHHISSMLNAEEPDLFQEFAASEEYRVSPFVKGHNKTLKSLKFYVFRSKKLTIEFDSGLVNETIFYDKETNELRITNVPDDLKRQLTNTEDEE